MTAIFTSTTSTILLQCISGKPGQLSFTPDYVKKKENHWTRQGWKTTFASKVNIYIANI